MDIHGHRIAVCSWSLQPKGMQDLVEKLKRLGIPDIQLAMLELVELDDKRKHLELGYLRSAGIGFTAAMIAFPGEDYSTIESIRKTGGYVPDDQWTLRRRLSREAARLCQELGIRGLTTHVGFVPRPGEAGYDLIRNRVREVAEDFAAFDVSLLMETGQEPADELLSFLGDLSAPNVQINFDPANMILYGAGDPLRAIGLLGRHITHVHVKDATASGSPGKEWGAEVPFGSGQVNPGAFLKALRAIGYQGPLAIEREAGNNRLADVLAAVETLTAIA